MDKQSIKEKRHSVESAHAKQLLGKSLPANIPAERALLGALLLHDSSLQSVSEILRPEDFYSPAHQIIYDTLLAIAESQRRPDFITLQDELQKQNKLDVVGGIVYLLSLQEDLSAVGLAEQYAKIIHEKAVLRNLINASAKIISTCYDQDGDEIAAVLDYAEKEIFKLAQQRSKDGFIQLDLWLKKTFEQLSDIKSHRRGVTGVPTGYSMLDEYTSGFQRGDLVVLAARPSMGKTAMALSLVRNAIINGYSVGFFSLEMSAEQLTLRLLSAESHVPHHTIRNATISSEEWVELTHAAARLAEYSLFIDDTPLQSVLDLRAKARKLKAEKQLDLLVVDYLQLLHTPRRHENRHQEVSEISRSLKALAKELEVPVIALSQLSRAVDSRVDKRPVLSDLRESGAIEQDADAILFLYRDIVYNPETEDPASAEIIIGKQRNGPTGTVNLKFVKEYTLFTE